MWVRDLRAHVPLAPGETQEMRNRAVNEGQPRAFTMVAVAIVVVVLATAGGTAGFFWALAKYGGAP
jgi:hypothetical protein